MLFALRGVLEGSWKLWIHVYRFVIMNDLKAGATTPDSNSLEPENTDKVRDLDLFASFWLFVEFAELTLAKNFSFRKNIPSQSSARLFCLFD